MAVLSPREHQGLVGHDTAAKQLKKSFDEAHLHHAILLAGPEGIGKETLAWQLMRYALAYPKGRADQDNLTVPEDAKAVKQILAGSHPHIFVIEPVFDEKKQRFKRDITLAALDGLTNFLRLAPTEDAPRFILVNPADGMNTQTQNALLKLLEEPPANTHFLLLVTQLGAILPTIRSRCLALTLEPLGEGDFNRVITKLQPSFDDDRLAAHFHLSGGAPGMALENEEIGMFEAYGGLCRALLDWTEEKDSQPAMRFAEEQSRDDILSDRLVETLLSRLSLFLKSRLSGTPLATILPEEEQLLHSWVNMPEAKILSLYDQINELWRSTEAGYLDRKLILLQIMGLLVASS